MYLTPENAKDHVGMKLYADRSIFHCYPFTVFQYPDGTYATKDSAGVCSPVSKEECKKHFYCGYCEYHYQAPLPLRKGYESRCFLNDITNYVSWKEKNG